MRIMNGYSEIVNYEVKYAILNVIMIIELYLKVNYTWNNELLCNNNEL